MKHIAISISDLTSNLTQEELRLLLYMHTDRRVSYLAEEEKRLKGSVTGPRQRIPGQC